MLALMKHMVAVEEGRPWTECGHLLTLASFVYWSAMFPVAMGFRIFRPDPTDRGLGPPDATTDWQPPRVERQDIRRAQRPW